jgi:N utilization substance protein B
MSRRPDRASRARSVSRKFVLQALYTQQLTAHGYDELRQQYATEEGFGACEPEYFDELLKGVTAHADELDARLRTLVDRPLERLDPIERAALWIGLYELSFRLEIPYRVVLNESVELTKRFGATDGHKYVNAILDRAARELRVAEQGAQLADAGTAH